MKTRAVVLRGISTARPYSGTRPVEVEELELGAPREGEVLVRIAAASLCHSDLSVVNGDRVRPLPMALGHEAVGVVQDTGPGVGRVSPGDHVALVFVPSCGFCADCAAGRPALCAQAAAANGSGALLHGPSLLTDAAGNRVHHQLGVSAFSEHAVLAQESVVPIPKDIPFTVASMFGCAVLTGAGAVINTAALRPGQSTVVYGLGGVGLSAVLGARAAGAYPIIAVDPAQEKRELALRLGATHAYAPDDALRQIRELTSGGAELAVEAVGSPKVMAECLTAVARGGKVVSVGLPAPDRVLEVPALAFAGEGKSLLGSYMGDAVPRRDIPRFLDLWRAGLMPVEQMHTGTLPLADINAAMEELASGRAIRQVIDTSGMLDA
ncbi:zinc-binding dehydrogenase [Streptomyces sp. NBC_01221]|uniref:zinc-binding dehydrogenase n=1 Tax=unclassified Streptomyces TaxID=2593676 RepID=UPI00224E16E2|nr:MULTISPECIES: zinc-binding dehydrogenase [unclassified Streptomyces]MCX4790196.1 zinc-binding dehydrogenase [Streptomyces sp. NBC_01221]MCX4794075.1 zinc-binding dehydrogenase [Streptomyces sp. NBC_01242]WSU20987.1 zinc-binding dehydrogenase [Streptomyces sp. NBC_01108]